MSRVQNYSRTMKTTEGLGETGCNQVPLVLRTPSMPYRYCDIGYDDQIDLYNRTCLEKEIRRMDNCNQLPVSIIIGDLNGLNNMNCKLGCFEGDKVLLEVAKIFKSCSMDDGKVVRYGGDEFLIFLRQASIEKVQLICKQIKKSYDKFIKHQENPGLLPSISLGYATKLTSCESIENTIRNAEELMNMRKLLDRKSLRSFLISSLKTTMLEKNRETEDHAERLVSLSRDLGETLKLSERQMIELELLAILHDIGKISIDNCILFKPDSLTDIEWAQIKKHPEVGCRIAGASPDLFVIANYILCHHERWDGRGYPSGLLGDSIPLLSRIIAVVDAFDAMTEDRPYRKKMSKDEALEEIKTNAGTQFDPVISDLFVNMQMRT